MRKLERRIDLVADIVVKVVSVEQVALCQRMDYVLFCEEQVCLFIFCLLHLVNRVDGLQGLLVIVHLTKAHPIYPK